jgi:hypothetical protein
VQRVEENKCREWNRHVRPIPYIRIDEINYSAVFTVLAQLLLAQLLLAQLLLAQLLLAQLVLA